VFLSFSLAFTHMHALFMCGVKMVLYKGDCNSYFLDSSLPNLISLPMPGRSLSLCVCVCVCVNHSYAVHFMVWQTHVNDIMQSYLYFTY